MNTRRAGMWDLPSPPSFLHFTPSLRLPQGLDEQGRGIYPSAFNTSESSPSCAADPEAEVLLGCARELRSSPQPSSPPCDRQARPRQLPVMECWLKGPLGHLLAAARHLTHPPHSQGSLSGWHQRSSWLLTGRCSSPAGWEQRGVQAWT